LTGSRTIFRNSLWTGVDLAFSFVTTFVTSVLVARTLGPAKLGYYSYILWLVQMTFLLASLGVPAATRKYLAEHFGRGQDQVAGGIIRLSLRTQAASALAVIAIGFALSLTLLAPEHRAYTQLAILSLFPAMLLAVATAVNWARNDFAANTMSSMVASMVHVAAVLFSLAASLDLPGLAAALLLSRAVDCGLRFALLRRRWPAFRTLLADKTALPGELRARIVRFGAQATAILVLDLVVWNRSEVFFLKQLCDIRAVAYFSLAFGLVAALGQLTAPLAWAASPTLMREQAREPREGARITAEFLRYLALVSVPATLGLAALAAPVVQALYGPAYAPAIPVVVLGTLLSLPSSLSPPAHYHLAAADAQSALVKWLALCAAITLGLDYWLVGQWCALGGAAANGAGQMIANLGAWTLVVRRFEVRLPTRDLGRILAAGSVMGALVYALSILVPPLVSLLVGPPLGALVYVLLVRRAGVLNERDHIRLLELAEAIPVRLRGAFRAAVGLLTGRPLPKAL
jgi:O-antigen/teichoic acid export membrane protein